MDMQENISLEDTQTNNTEKKVDTTKVTKPAETRIAGWTSLKEFSLECGITYEAVRQQVQKHSAVLEGHIKTIGKTRYLDSYAKKFLRGKKVNTKEAPVLDTIPVSDTVVNSMQKKVQEIIDTSEKVVSATSSSTTPDSFKVSNNNISQLTQKIDAQKNEISELKKKIRTLEDDIKQIEYDNVLAQSIIASMNVREFKVWKEKFKTQMRDTMDI